MISWDLLNLFSEVKAKRIVQGQLCMCGFWSSNHWRIQEAWPPNVRGYYLSPKNRFQDQLTDFIGCDNAKGCSASKSFAPDSLTRGSVPGSPWGLCPRLRPPLYRLALRSHHVPPNSGPESVSGGNPHCSIAACLQCRLSCFRNSTSSSAMAERPREVDQRFQGGGSIWG